MQIGEIRDWDNPDIIGQLVREALLEHPMRSYGRITAAPLTTNDILGFVARRLNIDQKTMNEIKYKVEAAMSLFGPSGDKDKQWLFWATEQKGVHNNGRN